MDKCVPSFFLSQKRDSLLFFCLACFLFSQILENVNLLTWQNSLWCGSIGWDFCWRIKIFSSTPERCWSFIRSVSAQCFIPVSVEQICKDNETGWVYWNVSTRMHKNNYTIKLKVRNKGVALVIMNGILFWMYERVFYFIALVTLPLFCLFLLCCSCVYVVSK